MSVFRLPNAMPETDKGRLPEGKRAYENGKATVNDPLGSRGLSRKCMQPWLAGLVLLVALGVLSACSGDSRTDLTAKTTAGVEQEHISPGGVRGLNYSRNYIHHFSVTGPRGMNGGGPNISPASKSGPSGGGAERCCIGIPQPWQPNTKLRIEWERDGKPYDYKDRSEFEVLTATVTVPEYGRDTYGFWAIFLPGDRVKVMVMDGNANGHNSVRTKPAEDDPFVVQGVRDDAQTKELQERYR
ncbi:DUF3304 domain-containing protein [Cupriavidus oxalaticus]|jgi:hypothetical protein|uniref:DUF3304 domain-containing protein n=2 Tax=Cupriavidus oxalaticus TaxID=96344 RepID=A0A375FTM1_9BURK|nr:DUF3304 domain-containing protein [Cupriavidus oxalaticus]WQD82136.1 DUF3304 domain-containing protein [Cupriavidus oxalaticus]SPC08569.1 conserved hypothetical protein [Cupriavidus oxalaticus]SPC14255.1 conserved hypothetical protein [Cupriavidus oxalaticus]